MTKGIILCLSFIAFFFVSCKNDNYSKEKTNKIYIDLSKGDYIKPEKVFKNTTFIPLETTKSSSLGIVTKIEQKEDKLYVLDFSQSNIQVFDTTGKHHFTIDRTGRGPGEYLQMYDFNFNQFANTLELMSPRGKVISCDLQGENCTEIIKLPSNISAIHSFEILSEEIIAFYARHHTNRLLFYDRTKGEIVKEILPNRDPDKLIRSLPLRLSPFYRMNGQLYFLDQQGYDLSILDPGKMELELKYSIDFGKNNFDIASLPKETEKDISIFNNYINENKIVFPISGFRETKQFIKFNLSIAGQEYRTILYDKDKGTSTWLDIPPNIHRDFFPYFSLSTENEDLGIILAPELTKDIFQNLVNEESKMYKELNNPVIIRHTSW